MAFHFLKIRRRQRESGKGTETSPHRKGVTPNGLTTIPRFRPRRICLGVPAALHGRHPFVDEMLRRPAIRL